MTFIPPSGVDFRYSLEASIARSIPSGSDDKIGF